ncbi:uncharacterized protein LOC6567674 isoform X2 [Drosophila grimshawi]|uniref:uncharacterized protein LOC6567674 isoform X2 n=1 Tax=Drosophila grimshawi TaxID=7222 RepID=UPI000C86E82E|nr:uncharacterized protein LOC6567674 isoform X2 [Drosophila grimshawi]
MLKYVTLASDPGTPQLSLKSRTPVILSKEAVEKLRLKFGQVQAQANAGALILTKPLKSKSNCNNNNNNSDNNNSLISKPAPERKANQAVPKSGTIAASTPTPLTMPTPVTGPTPVTAPTHLTTSTTAMPMLMPKPKHMPTPMPKLTPISMTASSNAIPTPLATPMPTPMLSMSTPLPMLVPTHLPVPTLMPSLNVDLPEIQISALPAATLNGAKLTKSLQTTSGVPKMPALQQIPSKIPNTRTTTSFEQQGSAKLQRSKSLAGNEQNPEIVCLQNNATERRHSVAIMAKEVDVVIEQPIAIETITIDDDDSDEEMERERGVEQKQKQKEQQQQQDQQVARDQQEQKQASRKNSTASRSSVQSIISTISSSSSDGRSSDVEVIIVPESQPEPPKPTEEVMQQQQEQQQQQQQQQQQHQQQQQQPLSNSNKLSIVRAETLSLSKEDFEKSLRCDEQVSISSPPLVSTTSNNSNSSSSLQPGLIEEEKKSEQSIFKGSMVQNFGMLQWIDQHHPGTLLNSNLRFGLNRYNLLHLTERCKPRRGPANYFERALFERPNRRTNTSSHPLLYLCSRCNCHGPASDFLSQHFCSLYCVQRANKRRHSNPSSNRHESKHSRMEESSSSSLSTTSSAKLTNGTMVHQQKQREKEQKPSAEKRSFRWSEYLKMKGNGNAAPIHLFLNPFPTSANCFERGMKLEAIDPENCSLFCVCTIVEVRGYRLKLNFDGYSSMYDFWVNADSMDIFPPGWCERTSRILQSPKDYCPDRFTWYRYLVKTNAKAAPWALFTHLNGPMHALINGFRVGMHLEAEDLNDTGKICVATIADVLDERIRVHFDGWDDCYDFWVHVNSPYIHPCGWHEGRQQLIVPPDYQNINFNWTDYINEVGGIAAPVELFAAREPMEFQAHMKLEVVDQRNPCLIRPATVVTRKGYRVQLHLDCWPTEYYFWLEDDSPDLHPIGWCEATLHELETPPGFQQRPLAMRCEVKGCRGYGNAKRFNLNVHELRDCCPYAPENWRQWRSKTVKPPRVLPDHIIQDESPKQQQFTEASTEVLLSSRSISTDFAQPKHKSTGKRKANKSRASLDELKSEIKLLKCEEEMPASIENKREPREPSPMPTESEVDPRCLQIAKSIVTEYGPQVVRNYHLWQTNSGFDMSQVKSNPLHWTNWDVFEFVERALKSTSIAQMLFDAEIDGHALLMIGRRDLEKYFQLKIGPAVKLFSLIVNLRIAVVCKFKTLHTERFPYLASVNQPTLNGKLERPESPAEESLSASPSGSEQMDAEDDSHEEQEEDEQAEDEQAEDEQEEDEQAEDEQVEDEQEEEDEEEEADEEEEDGVEEDESDEVKPDAEDEDEAMEDDVDYDQELEEEAEQERDYTDHKQYPKRELTDEDDVVLDNDDFLSVKPSFVQSEDKDADVVMTSRSQDLLPATDAVANIS